MIFSWEMEDNYGPIDRLLYYKSLILTNGQFKDFQGLSISTLWEDIFVIEISIKK